MNLTARIDLASKLGAYLLSNDPGWLRVKDEACRANPWFIPAFVSLATEQIAESYLDRTALIDWTEQAGLTKINFSPQQVGLVMAGNIPLVGFHDWLCIFMSGHHARVKLSSQDNVLFPHIREKLMEWAPDSAAYLQVEDRLAGADAYIATGSDNTARYFEFYFGRYPHIIRKNRTSVAVLNGQESTDELERLCADLYTYFGRGCRNVTQLWVPRNYSFEPLLHAGKAYQYLSEHHKFKNNYDYQLALRILNKEYYMSNNISLFVEQPVPFAPIGVVHYQYYDSLELADQQIRFLLHQLQCRVGLGGIPPGAAQRPRLDDYADGVNTLQFLQELGSRS